MFCKQAEDLCWSVKLQKNILSSVNRFLMPALIMFFYNMKVFSRMIIITHIYFCNYVHVWYTMYWLSSSQCWVCCMIEIPCLLKGNISYMYMYILDYLCHWHCQHTCATFLTTAVNIERDTLYTCVKIPCLKKYTSHELMRHIFNVSIMALMRMGVCGSINWKMVSQSAHLFKGTLNFASQLSIHGNVLT